MGGGSFVCNERDGYLRRVVFFRPVVLRAVVFFRPAVFFVVLRPVLFRPVAFFVVLRPVLLLVLRAVVFFRPVVFFVVFRPVVLRAVVFLPPPALVPPDAAGIGAAGGGVPSSGAGQLDAGSCCEPDQVSPRLPCSIKKTSHTKWFRSTIALRRLGIPRSRGRRKQAYDVVTRAGPAT